MEACLNLFRLALPSTACLPAALQGEWLRSYLPMAERPQKMPAGTGAAYRR